MSEASRPDTEAGSPWATEPLAKTCHDRRSFDSGEPALDRYLQKQALQDMRRYGAATYVMVDPDRPARIRGYYTLTSTSEQLDTLPDDTARRLPNYPKVSAVLIARLATDQRDRGQGVGAILLVDAIRRACAFAGSIGAALLVVEAKNDVAVRFYRHFGFRSFPDNTHQLFMSMLEAAKV